MLTDYRLDLSTGAPVTAGVATPTKSIDLQEQRDPGEGEHWYLTVVVGPIENNLLVELIAADDAALTSNVVVWLTTSVAGLTSSGAHVTLPVWNPLRRIGVGGVPILPVASSQKRYVGLRLTIADAVAFNVIGTLSPPAISPLIYPASTSS